MHYTILVDGKDTACLITFATTETQFLGEWRAAMHSPVDPRARDSYDFARSAYLRWKTLRTRENYAKDTAQINLYITDNPNSEVASFVVLSCDSFPASKIIGACHFRRTWCNNIVLDYLAVHPSIADKSAKPRVMGVGTALMLFVVGVANDLGCEMIWGEATQLSRGFYEKAFGIGGVKDLLIIPRERYLDFLSASSGANK